ncbi:MAG TPA: hypothetical protein HA224_04185 [Nanoarchaeota archaeon]|nr:hypothetical protein [Nanoarchaeota archaeon]
MPLEQPRMRGTLYYCLLGICLAIFVGFAYMSFLAYSLTRATQYFFLSYIIILPVFVAAFLFFLLVAVGKTGFYREFQDLKGYKVPIR